MSVKDHDFGSLVCIYAQLLPTIREAAKHLGYAIAIHGSMQRDLDLLAAPWTDRAEPAERLVTVIAEAVHGFVIGDVTARGSLDEPTKQPHGRRSWNIWPAATDCPCATALTARLPGGVLAAARAAC